MEEEVKKEIERLEGRTEEEGIGVVKCDVCGRRFPFTRFLPWLRHRCDTKRQEKIAEGLEAAREALEERKQEKMALEKEISAETKKGITEIEDEIEDAIEMLSVATALGILQ